MRKALEAVLLTGLFLLLLSALVVTPEEAAALPEASLPVSFQTVLRAADLPAVPTAAAPDRQGEARTERPLPGAPPLSNAFPVFSRDSNGRVLRAVRYENCVYQVFRAEVAGG